MGLGKHIINVDLFTDAYRVSGRTQVGAGGLLAELNNPNTDFLDLEDAYLSRMHQPARIVGGYSEVAFRKDNINFVIFQDRRDGTTVGTSHGRSVFTRGRPVQAFLTVPAFEIRGQVLYEGKPSPSSILVHTLGRFQPVFEAHASAALYPQISYQGDLILVQKLMIGIFCLDLHRSDAG